MIQKRLLNRFKDKNPSPLNNLDFLLGHTYNQIISMALQLENHMKVSRYEAANLGSTLECFLLCLRLKSGLPQDHFRILLTFVSPQVDIENETGWMESTSAAIRHMLVTYLGFGNKSLTTQMEKQLENST